MSHPPCRRAGRLALAVVLLGLVASTDVRADSTDDRLFGEANSAYAQGKYDVARQRYEQVVLGGLQDARLYYNLGNAYFRLTQLGRAIWAYEKALKIAPGHREAKFNMALARDTVQSRVHDKVIGARKKGRWERIVRYFSVTTAATWFLVLWYLAFGLGILWLLLRRSVLRSALLGLAIGALILATGVGKLYYDRVRLEDKTREAIVLDDKVEVRVSPKPTATKSFDIHAGLKVKIGSRDDRWVLIQLDNGLEGWVRAKEVGEL